MAFLESDAALLADAEILIRSFIIYQKTELATATDTSRGSKRAHEVRGLAQRAKSFAEIGERIAADPEFVGLPEKVRNDIAAIVTESRLAQAEAEEATEPDNIFARLSREQKAKVTDGERIEDAKVATLRARLEGRRRGIGANK